MAVALVSRQTVRAAVAAYLAPPAVPGLLGVHRAKPRNWAPELRFDAEVPSSMAGFVHIEQVIEDHAPLTKRVLHYVVAFVFVFRTSRTDAEQAVDDYDALVESIKARLRQRSPYGDVLGLVNSPTIFDAAHTMLEDSTDLPPDTALTGDSWGRVRFDVVEMINAQEAP